MTSFKKLVLLVVSTFTIFINPTEASLFGCSGDKERCINSCNERHRKGTMSFAGRGMCKARCYMSDCVFYPRKEKKSAHPSDRLPGFSV